MPGKPTVYWDSCAFIAHLNQEANKGVPALRHLKAMLASADDGDLQIVVSTLAIPEVLECRMSTDACKDFEAMMSSAVRGITVLDAGPTIMYKARSLREWSKSVGDDKKMLSTPDAIHLATAYYASAEKFYTFDGVAPAGMKDVNKKLLPLDGHMEAGMRILQPYLEDQGQGDLFDNG